MAAKVKNKGSETPLMKQYAQIKAKYPGALLLFRVGDFYETFGEDAVKTAGILDIVLTKRANGKAAHIELAGFPHHALDAYLPRLVRAGERVAICDQLEDPKKTKTIVKRGVTELVTPGVASNDKVLESKQNNYLAAICKHQKSYGIAFLDISTGEFSVAEGDASYIDRLLKSLKPSEILLPKPILTQFEDVFGAGYYTYFLDDWIFTEDFATERLTQQFGVQSLKGFGIQSMPLAITAAGAALYYLEHTHHREINHIKQIGRITQDEFMWLDPFTIANLEIVRPNQPGGLTLADVLDQTKSPMGSRLIKKWLVMPLKDLATINKRLEIVQNLMDNKREADELRDYISQMGDVERLISKVALKKISPREVQYLSRALHCIENLGIIGAASPSEAIKNLTGQLHPLQQLQEKINKSLVEEAPISVQKGNIFQRGVDPELDEFQELATHGKDKLLAIRQRELERTGIPSLKLAFNNVFGYYLEVTNTHKNKVPEDWIRKQTLTNAERYITPELKELETKILSAEEKIVEIELRLYEDFVQTLVPFIDPVQNNARIVAEMDCLLSFAQVSLENNYQRPKVHEGKNLVMTDCRHPVIEQQLPADQPYIPNDIYLNDSDQQIIILTGPNMSGKSAILRQTALAVIMAHAGCFVPAAQAEIGLTDKIFTRVGASDNISQGESTFMVEMIETASILNNLSDRSLILLDEIGRGTSTYDGVSLAWAIAEHLGQTKEHPKTLFATHYHELNELEKRFEGIINYHVSTKETGNKVLFLRKLVKGGSEHSFGIHVAKMAGVPTKVVKRAKEILGDLESNRQNIDPGQLISSAPQLHLFQLNDPELQHIAEEISKIDTNTLTPLEALMKLNDLKQKIESTKV